LFVNFFVGLPILKLNVNLKKNTTNNN